ncbi:MAG TPA: PHP domain-containing protein, partial [candidate division Zixibacteria bacterium]|nr:PHP domain-containing protein [candidate division Zixibacteria bacterium]
SVAQHTHRVPRRLLHHVHTRRSHDSLMSPEDILAFARRHAIDAVLVTDHDTHLGAADCRALIGPDDPLIPLAAEYKSTQGDMICAFIREPITSRDPMTIIRETHRQDGLVILPHPFRFSDFSHEVLAACDAIEVFNARTPAALNTRAHEAAQQLGKAMIAGPDAHRSVELPLALNEYEVPADWDWPTILRNATPQMITRYTRRRDIYFGQVVKSCRQVRPILFGKSLIRWLGAAGGERVS